jgi:hypothetical protein
MFLSQRFHFLVRKLYLHLQHILPTQQMGYRNGCPALLAITPSIQAQLDYHHSQGCLALREIIPANLLPKDISKQILFQKEWGCEFGCVDQPKEHGTASQLEYRRRLCMQTPRNVDKTVLLMKKIKRIA